MNIYHLKYFVDAAKLQSVSQSATLNRVSHSAVSQSIKSLEDVFEVKLIFHSKRRFQLTPEGEMCFVEAEKILKSLETLKEVLKINSKEVSGSLVLWAPQSLVVDSLYKALSTYQKRYPKVNIELKTGASSQVRAAVSAGDVHIGMLVDDGLLAPYNQSVLKRGEFVLVGKTAKLAQNEKVIVTYTGKIEVKHLAKNFKEATKKQINFGMQVSSWGVIKNLVLKNLGVGYLPDYCVASELQQEKLFRIKTSFKPFQYSINAIWPKNKRLHPNAKLFLDVLKEQIV